MNIFLLILVIPVTASLSAVLLWYFISREMPAKSNTSGILVYHRVENKLVLGSTWTTEKRFRKQIEYLHKSGYKCVDLEKKTSNSEAGEYALTFDDALLCLYKHAVPVLREYSIPAMFFVVSNFIGKISEWDVYKQPHMGKAELSELLSNGFEIGSHTATHPDLTRLSPRDIKRELITSKKSLEDMFGVEINYLSYPFGRFNSTVQQIAGECGYKGALTINHPLKETIDENYAIPAHAVYLFDGLHNIENKIRGDGMYQLENLKNKIINRFASGTGLFVQKQ